MTLEQEIQIREKEIAEKVAAQVAEQVREETWKEAREETWAEAERVIQEKTHETQIETVQKLINSGLLSLEDISKALGIPIEKVNELATR